MPDRPSQRESLDPFALFGVDPATADEGSLARAYRDLRSQCDVDEAPARAARLQRAYELAQQQLRHRYGYLSTLVDGPGHWPTQFVPPPLAEDSEGAHAMADAEKQAALLLGDHADELLEDFAPDSDDAGDTDIDIPTTDPDAADGLDDLLANATPGASPRDPATAELVERLRQGHPIAAAVVVSLRGARLQALAAATELAWNQLRDQRHRWAATEIFAAGLIERLVRGDNAGVVERLDVPELAEDLAADTALQQVVLETLCGLAWRAPQPARGIFARLLGDVPDDLGDQRQHLVDRFRAVLRFAAPWAEARDAGGCPRALADFIELAATVNGPAVEALAGALRDSLTERGDGVWTTICAVAERDPELLAFLNHELAQSVGPELALDAALTPDAAAALADLDRASRPRLWQVPGRLVARNRQAELGRELEGLAAIVYATGLGPDNIANWAQTRGVINGLGRFAGELRGDARLSLHGAVARARLGLQRPGRPEIRNSAR